MGNVEYKDLMAGNGAAKELLAFAKNMGSEAAPTDAPSGIAGTGIGLVQIHSHVIAPRAPPPDTWGAYSSKSQENGGVIAMINLLIKDLDKEMTEAETDEKNAQAAYETMMTESTGKRTADSKSLSGKVSTLASSEGELVSLQEAKKAAGAE